MNTESLPRTPPMTARRNHLHWPYAGLIVALALLTLLAGRRGVSAEEPPTFLFPWQDGVAWQTGMAGFHGGNDALDFLPPDTPFGGTLRCMLDPDWVFEESAYWILASAPGTVADVQLAYILLDHGNGWYSRYYHLAEPQVVVGETVAAGQRLGHPSNLGDCSTGPQVHFWVQGPAGETTQDISLSGVPTTSIEVNQWISETGNFDTGSDPTPTPTPAPTETPASTDTPTPSPTPAPLAGDADCNGLLSPADAVFILRYSAELEAGPCTPETGEITCDGVVDTADAVRVLEAALAGSQTVPACTPVETPAPTPEVTAEPTPETSPAPAEITDAA